MSKPFNPNVIERIFLGIPDRQIPQTLDDYLPDVIGRIRVYLMIVTVRRK